MRIVSWNLAHQTKEAPLSTRFAEALEHLRPDVLVLNEFVDGATRAELRVTLASMGLPHVLTSNYLKGHNQILIASRYAMTAGSIAGPHTEEGAGASNFLHVTFPEFGLDLIGMRAPAYKHLPLKEYWVRLSEIIRANVDKRLVVIGDLNADPDRTSHVGSRHLAELRTEGWKLPSPAGTFSFLDKSRIDHVLGSPSVEVASAEYVNEIGEWKVSSSDKGTRISDHAALVVVVESGSSKR